MTQEQCFKEFINGSELFAIVANDKEQNVRAKAADDWGIVQVAMKVKLKDINILTFTKEEYDFYDFWVKFGHLDFKESR